MLFRESTSEKRTGIGQAFYDFFEPLMKIQSFIPQQDNTSKQSATREIAASKVKIDPVALADSNPKESEPQDKTADRVGSFLDAKA